ncbi:MAG TPA: tRNA lysidine(34) synthetase TilS [Nocardioidaceae bacterium]|nr:tRNA lysidine(34) synthetase TilS [Nocardioidaceae bacterium]
MGPHPAVAAVRLAVRRTLLELPTRCTLVVACSGGADSLALVAATVFESRRAEHTVIGLTVDHGLQTGSRQHAEAVADQMRTLGVSQGLVAPVSVGAAGGPEAAARTARYAALDRAADEHDAAAVLLGHTRDDQAETVLLGLARGSGARSLSGMASVTGRYRRPLLGLSRADTVAACGAENISFWDDPHNADPSYARVRVRRQVLPVLEKELGPGVTEALARTARLLRDDADALDAMAVDALLGTRDEDGGLLVEPLLSWPAAVRRRVLRLAALDAGCPGTELFLVHVDALDELVTDWHGQRGVDLPGPVHARRAGGALRFAPGPVAG